MSTSLRARRRSSAALLISAGVLVLVSACETDVPRAPEPTGVDVSRLETEQPEPCTTPNDRDWKSFYYAPNGAPTLDSTLTRSQLDVDDAKVTDSLDGLLDEMVKPLPTAKLDDDLQKQLDVANSKLGGLSKIGKEDQYAKQKAEIFKPLDIELLDFPILPNIIDGTSLDPTVRQFLRPEDWPHTLPPSFTDLRVRPAACGAYVSDQAEHDRLRVYRNIELSQVYVQKTCLDPDSTLTVETSALEDTVDTVVYLWDPATSHVAAMNDDAVHGSRASRAVTASAGSRRCLDVIVMNQRPRLAGKTRVTSTIEHAGTSHERVLEVQLRTFPEDIYYAATDVDFEVASTRYTDLPATPTALPLALFSGSELVGFDFDSGAGPAAKVRRSQLGSRRPTRAIVLGRSVEARDFTFTSVYVSPDLARQALRPVNPFLEHLVHDDPPELDPSIFPPSVHITAPPTGFDPVAPGGRVDLVLDDLPVHHDDGDADGIGALTEAQLCTCDPNNRQNAPAGWYDWCDERAEPAGGAPADAWFADTDHDGLTDREEVFGVELDQRTDDLPEPEGVFRTIALPVWGADPLQKDMFMELDFLTKKGHPDAHVMQSAGMGYLDDATGLPRTSRVFRGELFDTLDSMFIAGARSDLRNPNGIDGIRVHVDVGANPILTDEGRTAHCAYVCGTDAACLSRCSDSVDRERFLYRHRVFGRWGGGGTRVRDDIVDPSTPEGLARLDLFCARTPSNTASCPWGDDKTPPTLYDASYRTNEFFDWYRRRYFRYGLVSPYDADGGQAWAGAFGSGLGPFVIAHETGHTLGLSHAGHPSWGDYNCKPNYLSCMNYAYNYDPRIGFSSADTSTSSVVDPSNIREVDFQVRGLTPEATTLLTHDKFRFQADTSRLDASGNGPADIDWNLSASYEPGSIRAPATWCPWPGEATRANQYRLMERPEDSVLRGGATPDLVHVGDHLYAFYVDQAGRLRYRYGTLGPKSKGSCDSQRLGERCMTWSAEKLFTTTNRVEAVSVAAWEGQLVVAYTEQAPASSLCEQHMASSAAISADGSIASWTSADYGRLVQCRDVELVALPVDASVAPSGKIMSVFARAWDDAVLWIKSTDPLHGGTWHEDRALDAAGAPMSAPITPSVAVWPSSDYESLGSADWNARATACAVFPETQTLASGETHVLPAFYCLDRATARWQRKTSFASDRLGAKPSIAFHVLRRADGEPIDPVNMPSQLWFAYVPESSSGRAVAWIKVSSELDRSTPPTDFSAWSMVFNGRHGNHWDYVTPGSGAVIHEELALGAMKGITNLGDGYYFQPFADGTFQAELKTGNDFQVMEAGLCRNLRSGDAYCPDWTGTAFGY
jgi:hypothetical protein